MSLIQDCYKNLKTYAPVGLNTKNGNIFFSCFFFSFFFFLVSFMLLSLTCMLVNSLPKLKPNLVTLQKKKKNYFLFESLFVFFVTSTPFRLHTRAQLAASDVTRFFVHFNRECSKETHFWNSLKMIIVIITTYFNQKLKPNPHNILTVNRHLYRL